MPKLQHIRSATPDKRPDPALLVDGQLSINTAATTPGVYTKNDAGGLIKVGPTHIGTTAPNSAAAGAAGNSVGEHWMDTSVAPPVLRVWDGSAWLVSQGLTGPAGTDGAAGAQGPAGNDGAAGAQGPAGNDGAAGGQGPAGADGAAGPQGPQGDAGAAGAQGPAGVDGAAGGPGADGAAGPAGPAGADSVVPGPAGPAGADGAAGGQGPAGNDGAAGAQGPQGDSLFTLTPGDQIVPVEQIRTLQITGGSATSPAYGCIGGIGTGISFPSATELQLNTENVARLTINSAGGWNVNGSPSEVGLVLTGNGWAQPPSWKPAQAAIGGMLFASVAFSPKNGTMMRAYNIVSCVNISNDDPPRDGRFAIIFAVPDVDNGYSVASSNSQENTHLTGAHMYMGWEDQYRPYVKNADGFRVYFVSDSGSGQFPTECNLIVAA